MGETERVAAMELASIFPIAFYEHFAATRLARCRKEKATKVPDPIATVIVLETAP